MQGEIDVDVVVDTFGLAPKMAERLKRIAAYRMNEMGITSPDDQYRYMTELAERFSTPRHERRCLRLDSSVGDSDTTFHEIIGAEDPYLNMLFEDEQQALSTDDVLSILEDYMDEYDMKLLFQMAHGKDLRFSASPEELSANIDEIRKRFDEFIHRYERNGRIAVPNRTIVSISFDPLSIEFKRGPLSQDQKDRIKELLVYYKGDVRKVVAETRNHFQTIIRRAEIEGIDIKYENIGYRHIPRAERDRIVDSLRKSRGDATKAAIETRHSLSTVERYGAEYGVKIFPRKRKKYHRCDEEDETKMIKAYHEFEGNANRASLYVPYNVPQLLRHWKKHGLITRPSGGAGNDKTYRFHS